MAAAGNGRIGAAWVVPYPPAKIRPAIPIANTVRNICVSPCFPYASLVAIFLIKPLVRRRHIDMGQFRNACIRLENIRGAFREPMELKLAMPAFEGKADMTF